MRSARGVLAPTLSAVMFAAVVTGGLHAQCPDGTPPPCRVAAAPRAARSGALDPRTWVVLPFVNVTREPDIAWLSDAAVNLLYLDLSRWSDIRVIDDGRVADLVRTLPAAEREQIGLNTGLGLARRLGAGRLVMGDLVKSGARTTVVAKVYDVASGRRLRTVQENFTSREATMPAFARLAGRVVDAPLPPGVSPDAVGTRSLDAYQEYVAGLAALNSWQLDSARVRFERALREDSTFALAHYRLSITLGWSPGAGNPGPPAEAASRFSASLPPRERALIRGQEQMANNRYQEACDTFRGLLAADSGDVEAWYQLGECTFHDGVWLPVSADSQQWRVRGDLTLSYRAFLRTLELDPDMHLAYEHLLDMLRSRPGCCWCAEPQCRTLVNQYVELRGDSLFRTGTRVERGQRGNPPNWDIYRRNLEAAAQIGRRWLEAAPDEAEAHYQYGLVLMGLQRFSDAASEFAAARRLNLRPQPGAWALEWQIECLFQADSVSRRALPTATALLDSLARGLLEEPIMTRDTAELQWVRRAQRASHAALSGSPSRVPERIGAPPWNPRAGNPDGWFRAIAQLAAGSSPRNLDAVMARLQDQGLPPPFALAWNVVGHLCAGGLCSPQGLSENAGWRASALALALAGQTDSARAVLRRLDSTQTENERFRGGSIEMGFRIAVSHLALGDTAGALAALSRVARLQPFFYVIGLDPAYPLGHHAWVLGRVWLLHADLLRATGRTEDSHLYYRRVADLWSRADPEIRVFADRARAQLPDWMRQP